MTRVIKMSVATNRVGSRHEETQPLPDDWDEMNEEEQAEYLDEAYEAFLANSIDGSAWVEDDGKE